MEPELRLTDAPTEADREAIESGLIAYNRLSGIGNDWRPLAVLIKEHERTVGGLTGFTMWGWLFVGMFFIPLASRGKGLGARVLQVAESEAGRRHCVGVWLDTHDWQARPFYEKQGYEVFAEIPDYPPGHQRYLVRKLL